MLYIEGGRILCLVCNLCGFCKFFLNFPSFFYTLALTCIFFYRMCTIDGLLTIQNRLCVPLCSYSREKSLLKASATVMTSRKLKLQLQKVSATVRLNILAKFILFVYFYAKSQVFRSFFLAYVRNILHFLWVYANLATEGS